MPGTGLSERRRALAAQAQDLLVRRRAAGAAITRPRGRGSPAGSGRSAALRGPRATAPAAARPGSRSAREPSADATRRPPWCTAERASQRSALARAGSR